MTTKNRSPKISNYPSKPYDCEKVKLEMYEVSDLVGQVLTIVEAAIVDKGQLDAIKSILKRAIWDWGMDWKFGATEEQLKLMQKNSIPGAPNEMPQIPHLDS